MEKGQGAVGEDKMDEELAAAIKTLWAEPAIQQVYAQRANFQVGLSCTALALL